jgi:hypothetical protein
MAGCAEASFVVKVACYDCMPVGKLQALATNFYALYRMGFLVAIPLFTSFFAVVPCLPREKLAITSVLVTLEGRHWSRLCL